MLHEAGDGSARRFIRDTAVLRQTVDRVASCDCIDAVVVLCWEDQVAAASGVMGETASIVPVGPRGTDRAIELVRRSQAWADGWRGGPMMTCPADRGWHATAVEAVADATDAAFLYAVDASFALLDVELTSRLIGHAIAAAAKAEPVSFTPAPPGLVGHVVSREAVWQLASQADAKRQHPGSLLHYHPDRPRLDPIGLAASCAGPSWLTHGLGDYRIDTDARTLLAADVPADLQSLISNPLPERRDATVDLTTRRRSKPIWLTRQPDCDLDLEALTDLRHARVTLAGQGDPLLHPQFAEAVAHLRTLGVASIHVETDLLGAFDIATLTTAGVDIVSVHLPATTAATYAAVMGTNGMATALGNLARLITADTGMVIVPTFTKLAINVGEMEGWYDQWIRLAGAAVIRGPDAFNMSPADDVSSLAAAPIARTDRQPVGTVLRPAA